MKSSIKDRFNKLLVENNVDNNISAFAKKLGISSTAITKILAGDTMPSAKVLVPLKKHFPTLDLNWLMVGEGEMILGDSIQQETINQYNHTIDLLVETNKLKDEKIERLEKDYKELLAEVKKLRSVTK